MLSSKSLIVVTLLGACSFEPQGAETPTDGGPVDTSIDGVEVDVDADPSAVAKRRPITILGARIAGNVDDFPVWLELTGSDVPAARVDGQDLYFTDDAGLAIPYEIRSWSQGTRLQAWVKVALTQGTDTKIFVRYGGVGGVPAPSPTTVFDNAFAAVWHMDDTLQTPTVIDATGTHPGTATAGLGPSDSIAGKLGGGIDFDGDLNAVTFTNPYTGNQAHTISAWVFQRDHLGFDAVVVVGTPMQHRSRFLYTNYNSDHIGAGFFANDVTDAGININNAGWTLVHWVFEGSNRTSRLYRNGTRIHDDTFQPGIATQGTDGYLGWSPTGWGGDNGLNGTLDEIRLATAQRDDGWIATEFANQNAPSEFYLVGAEELVP